MPRSPIARLGQSVAAKQDAQPEYGKPGKRDAVRGVDTTVTARQGAADSPPQRRRLATSRALRRSLFLGNAPAAPAGVFRVPSESPLAGANRGTSVDLRVGRQVGGQSSQQLVAGEGFGDPAPLLLTRG